MSAGSSPLKPVVISSATGSSTCSSPSSSSFSKHAPITGSSSRTPEKFNSSYSKVIVKSEANYNKPKTTEELDRDIDIEILNRMEEEYLQSKSAEVSPQKKVNEKGNKRVLSPSIDTRSFNKRMSVAASNDLQVLADKEPVPVLEVVRSPSHKKKKKKNNKGKFAQKF